MKDQLIRWGLLTVLFVTGITTDSLAHHKHARKKDRASFTMSRSFEDPCYPELSHRRLRWVGCRRLDTSYYDAEGILRWSSDGSLVCGEKEHRLESSCPRPTFPCDPRVSCSHDEDDD